MNILPFAMPVFGAHVRQTGVSYKTWRSWLKPARLLALRHRQRLAELAVFGGVDGLQFHRPNAVHFARFDAHFPARPFECALGNPRFLSHFYNL